MDTNYLLNELLNYGIDNLGLDNYEVYFRINELRRLFKLNELKFSRIKNKEELPDLLLENITKRALDLKIEMISEAHFKDQLMGIVTPSHEAVVQKFFTYSDPKEATNYLYNLGVKNYYIQKTAIDRNIFFGNDKVEFIINLSRPEKDNKQTAKLLETKKIDFPACMLCLENLGYEGRDNYPARYSIRIIPLTLGNERWFMQFSPYSYFPEHAILINEKHQNMVVNEQTFSKMLDFVKVLPHYFVGSNASLPIIGGSILNHEHYQAGSYHTPLRKSTEKRLLLKTNEVFLYEIDWFLRSIRLKSENPEKLRAIVTKVNDFWENYSDETAGIKAKTGTTQHSALTPFCYKEGNYYVFDLIFRNNYTNKKYPDGVFHVAPEYQNIKKEAIGLLEASGYFVLPGRLKAEIERIAKVLVANEAKISADESPLNKHYRLIQDVIDKFGIPENLDEAEENIKNTILDTCAKILASASCFKATIAGDKAFEKLIKTLEGVLL
ncbi:MAG: DUF4922 domain-containing protein [Erysipelotrichales bacterium]|nr:DUF4922 domain-containing protein [Erysipelotrichales bacterium]